MSDHESPVLRAGSPRRGTWPAPACAVDSPVLGHGPVAMSARAGSQLGLGSQCLPVLGHWAG